MVARPRTTFKEGGSAAWRPGVGGTTGGNGDVKWGKKDQARSWGRKQRRKAHLTRPGDQTGREQLLGALAPQAGGVLSGSWVGFAWCNFPLAIL